LSFCLKIAAAGLLALCSAAGTASACQHDAKALFDENFKSPDPGWGQADNVAAFTPDGLALTPPVSGSAWRWNASYSMAKNDWCVEVMNPTKLPDPPDEDAVGAVGLWFWDKDQQNFYTAKITLYGEASVWRLAGGQWTTIFPAANTKAVKSAPGAVNEIEVVTNAGSAKFYVNGTLITEVSGNEPPNGGAPGIYGESSPKGTTWLFKRARLF
jgi:hypothetical protein